LAKYQRFYKMLGYTDTLTFAEALRKIFFLYIHEMKQAAQLVLDLHIYLKVESLRLTRLEVGEKMTVLCVNINNAYLIQVSAY